MISFLEKLAEITIYSSIIIAIVFLIKIVFKNKIKLWLISFLWTVVIFRLLMPITVSAPLHFDSLFYVESDDNVKNDENAENKTGFIESNIDSPIYSQPISYNDSAIDIDLAAEKKSATPKLSTIDMIVERMKEIDIWSYIFIFWILGSFITAIININRIFIFNNKVKHCKNSKNTTLQRVLCRNKRYLDIDKDINIITSDYIDIPITYGLINPVIIVPTKLLNSLSYQKLKLVVMHELCHIKRKDILKSYLWLTARIIYWFNPLVAIAYRSYQDDIELACDEMVIKKINNQEKYEYTQSLVDVIKLANNTHKLPLAISFCKKETKIKERVLNILKPQKKSKSAGFISILCVVIILITCFTTACQPTPEKSIVQNKKDNELEEAIQATAEPVSNEEDSTVEHINKVITNDKGNISINIDVTAETKEINYMSVAYVEPYDLSQEEVDTITSVLIGDRDLLEANSMTREQIEEAIIHIKKSANDLDSDLAQSNGIDNLADLNDLADSRVAMYKDLLEDAPESPNILGKLDINDPDNITTEAVSLQEAILTHAEVDFGTDERALISYSNTSSSQNFRFWNFGKDNMRRYLEADSKIYDMNKADQEFLQIQEVAMDYFNNMNINDMKLSNVYICGDRTRLYGVNDEGIEGECPIGSTNEYYVFSFSRVVNGQFIDNAFYEGSASSRDPDDIVYDRPLPYEYFELWMDGTELVQFIWANPLQIQSVENTNVKIQIDSESAINIMSDQLFIQYADMFSGKAKDIQVNITDVKLVLARVKEQDTGKFLIVPVYDIYGEIKVNIPDEDAQSVGISKYVYEKEGDYYIMSEINKSILTINSLDGSILNRATGY